MADDMDFDPEMNGAPAPKQKDNKRLSVERIYQKKTQLEHILLRPDSYIGSVATVTQSMWVMNEEEMKMTQRDVTFVPGLFKIFDEILVNAADNKVRDPTMSVIKIEVNPETNKVSVWNNGKGIPVVQHKTEKMYVPTMIFGHLLTSSNYDDTEKKVTGGRNGYGAKLCNIFSTKFVVETSCGDYHKSFKQTWTNNMTKTSEPRINEASSNDFTSVTFYPDLAKFGMEKLDKDIYDIFVRRAYDIAGCTTGVKVFLNGKKLPIKNFKDYIDLYVKDFRDDNDQPLKVVHEKVGARWEVAVTSSEKGFQQASFVNSIATTKGGRHVDLVVDQVVNKLLETVKKKNKGGVNIKPFQVKNHLWVFVNCQIENPTFDSQTKENMTLQAKSFGSKPSLSDKFINQVNKSGVVESIMTWMSFKAKAQLQGKCKATKTSKLKGIPKLDDANDAGTKNSMNCTLILTEGDSAKTLAVAGLGVVGRDKYGVFPLKGKVLNVREATHKQIMENAEINNIIKILGLQYKQKYDTPESLKSLRYGKLMIMTDQDQDGSHIKGLLINFLHHNWPSLLQRSFIEQFITPIVKVTKKKESLSFYSLPEFEEWKSETQNWHTWKVKYYKGLGTSTAKEAKEYFANMERHRIRFKYSGAEDDACIELAFSKKKIDDRKGWLTTWMEERKRRSEMDLPELYLYGKQTKQVSYNEFVNRELILFSNMDNERSIPCVVDGLKPGQRKVLFTCLKRNDKNEVKVAQLAGSVAEHSAYHHGEVSLMGTIVNLAQNFVGSNNLNLLQPIGQFGTRLHGGKDSASPRYIFTMLSPAARSIFHSHDEPMLRHLYDDNQKIEPQWYCPIIPMVLVNGAEGIGTGWSTRVLQYNPRDLVEALRAMMAGNEPKQLLPWFRGFTGTMDEVEENRYVCNGEIAILDDNTLEITELPVRTWTQSYKENVLEPMLNGTEKGAPVIQDYKEYHTEATVRFVVKMDATKLREAELNGLHKFFKIQSSMTTNSMVLFDHNGCIKRYTSPMEILREFYDVRLQRYQIRKDYLEGLLAAEALKLENMARFILEIVEKKITVDDIKNKSVKELTSFLLRRGYDSDPLKAWKQAQEKLRSLETNNADDDDDDDDSSSGPDYHYLYDMPLRTLTKEKRQKLLKERDDKAEELRLLRRKTPKDLWTEDLDAFMGKLEQLEETERLDAEGGGNKKAKKEGFLKGKKNFSVQDCRPSPHGLRVEPKIEVVVKKEKKAKKVKEEDPTQTNLMDAFSAAGNDGEDGDQPKSLSERLGLGKKTAAAKKPAQKKEPGEKKPAKPRNPSGSPRKKQKKKNPWSDSESDRDSDDMSDSDGDTDRAAALAIAAKERNPRRTAAKNKRYTDSGDENESDEEFFDNPGAVENDHAAEAVSDHSENESPQVIDDDDDDDEIFSSKRSKSPPKKKTFDDVLNESRDDDDDEKKKKKPAAAKKVLTAAQKKQNGLAANGTKQQSILSMFGGSKKDKEIVIDDSETPAPSQTTTDSSQVSASALFATKSSKAKPKTTAAKPKAEPKKRAPKKKKLSDSEDDSPVKKPKKTTKKAVVLDSDTDEYKASPKKKAPAKRKKPNFSDSDDDGDFDAKLDSNFVPDRVGRAKKQVKYAFDDSDDESD